MAKHRDADEIRFDKTEFTEEYWQKNIAPHVRRLPPEEEERRAEAIREVVMYEGCQADDALAVITNRSDS
jgi:hypothetical protein